METRPGTGWAAGRKHTIPWLIAGLLVAVFALAGSLVMGRSPAAGQGGPTEDRPYVAFVAGAASDGPLAEPTEEPTPGSGEETVALVAYFLRDGLVAPVHREVEATVAVGTAAMEELLAGPTDEETDTGLGSAVPEGTELLGLTIDDGVATVDLSGEFASGGGSFSVRARIAQVVYTLTQFETVDGVLFSIDGELVEVFSSEGLVLDGPATPADFEDLTPAILVQSPGQGATVTSPARITGTANTFEAVFQLQIIDNEGQIIADEVVMATSGTGTRGTFDVTVPFDLENTGGGLIKVFVYSAQDGEPTNIREIPVNLQTDDEPPGETTELVVYFLRDEEVAAVHREVEETVAVAEAAMEALLAGPTDAEADSGLFNAVPEGTELLGISISDGIATVDLSGEFESGGGSLSMFTRLAQVVYTLTQFETVDEVVFYLDGELVEVFSNEGIIIDGPLGPDNFEDVTPAILVQRPGQGATVSSPVRITGTANTFEATFILTIVDNEGEIIAEEVVTATSGSGTRGTFDVTVHYDLERVGGGAIIVFEESAQDGEPVNVVEIPVDLQP